ncbi:HpcH/HpaI aldolase/citrate lyase family protein [Streptomyces malaysiensis]|uniref:CoA ester lyase n=1 Tax=Streptomyces malaysiensis subsp. samsunensis TaxID=459658 RepID=A0A9X2S185_STRMQ|nr:CoA ester lyase [Streptomyces samsunensis]MCQ8835964.1 CoA ester lyase [Streptomyces samsunensis]
MGVSTCTWLFVPATTPQRFAGAAASGADAVILDLEDAVGVDAKDSARGSAAAWLSNGGRAWVRVNATGTPWHDNDVAALAGLPGVLGLVVPKAEDPVALTELAGRLPAGRGLVALVESALGVHRSVEIAETPGVERLAFGSLDFAVDVRAEHVDEALLLARSTLVLASRVAGLPAPIDGVTTSVCDTDLVAAEARRSRALGFGGKLCIHPAQLEAVARVFAPTAEQLAWARGVVEAAAAAGGGVVAGPDGHMIDKPVIDRARAILRD